MSVSRQISGAQSAVMNHMNKTRAVTVETPDGAFTTLLHDGSVVASGWVADHSSLIALVHQAVRETFDDVEVVDPLTATNSSGAPQSNADGSGVVEVVAAVTDYYAGDLSAPARVSVLQRSGEFREHTWDVLRLVEPGAPVTYSELADRSGRPAAVRAAAGACAMNAAALFVPCHRVLRTNGELGGFRYGLQIKQRLLARESGVDMLLVTDDLLEERERL